MAQHEQSNIMLHRKHSNATFGGVMSTAATFGIVAITGCLQVNPDHCIAGGGDLYCEGNPAGSMCTMSLGVVDETSHDGCMGEVTEGLVHVRYGLPSRLGTSGDESLDTVMGVVNKAAKGCDVDARAENELREPFSVFHDKVLVHLDGRSRVRRGFRIDEDAVSTFNGEVGKWIPDCETGTDTGTSTETDGGTDTTQGTNTSGSSTASLPQCSSHEDCSDGAPFCELGRGECVSCEGMADPDAACAEVDAGLPVCSDGVCVECTSDAPEACGGETPFCDDASRSCVPACTEHAQCGEAACNFYTGACLPADAVVHVGPGRDFPTLSTAVASFSDRAEGTIIVHKETFYNESVTVEEGRVMGFLAASGDAPVWFRSAGYTPQLTVAANSTVLMDGIELSGNVNSRGLHVTGGHVWIDRSRIIHNNGGGILADTGAELTLRNCFVGSADTISVDVASASALVLYSTVTTSTDASVPALRCTLPVAIDIRNSIIVSAGGTSPDELSCPGASVTTSATEADVGEFSFLWFIAFFLPDLHLSPNGAMVFANLAQWTTGDPLTDIDGDPRPASDGSPDYPGADVP